MRITSWHIGSHVTYNIIDSLISQDHASKTLVFRYIMM